MTFIRITGTSTNSDFSKKEWAFEGVAKSQHLQELSMIELMVMIEKKQSFYLSKNNGVNNDLVDFYEPFNTYEHNGVKVASLVFCDKGIAIDFNELFKGRR